MYRVRRGSVMGLAFMLLCATVLYVGSISESMAAPGSVNGRIAFASSRDGNFEIYVMDLDGTNEDRLTNHAAADTSPSWSPNGTKIAFVRGGSIHVIDADGTDIKKVSPTGLVSSDPVWSPDGKKILFSAITDGKDRDIYEMDASGAAVKDLTGNSPSDDFEPRYTPDSKGILFTSAINVTSFGIFGMNATGQDRVMIFGNSSSMHPQLSPNGTRIVFSSNMQSSFDIYTMELDGTNVTRLTGGSSNESYPSWSPDGNKITYTSDKGAKYEQVYIMDHNGANQQRLTRNQHTDLSPEIQPLSSPVKERLPILRGNGLIAFATDERKGTFAELRAMHPDGTNITQIGSDVESIDSYPRWSPSGDKIAFISKLDSHEEIVVTNPDGTKRTSLIQSTSPFNGLAWSPNGTQLVFAKGDINHSWIFVMNSDGTGIKRLTITDWMDIEPSWSPDGKKIAFARNVDGNSEIYIMDPDGTKQKRLTESTGNDRNPRWSPEADQIVFVSNRDGNDEIYVMNVEGKAEKNLSNHTAADYSPSWSPDGSSIIFVSDRSPQGPDIHVMDSDGKNVERLSDDGEVESQPDFGSSPYTKMDDGPGPIDGSEEFYLPLDTTLTLPNSIGASANLTARNTANFSVAITNTEDNRFRVVAIMQVRDTSGVTQFIDSAKGAVAAESTANFTFSWAPEVPGNYDIVVFVIENSDHPQILGQITTGKAVVTWQRV